MHVIACGEIVKDYSDDRPCPSFLMLGNSRLDQRLIYVVIACCHDYLMVIPS